MWFELWLGGGSGLITNISTWMIWNGRNGRNILFHTFRWKAVEFVHLYRLKKKYIAPRTRYINNKMIQWKYFQKLAQQIYCFTESTQYPITHLFISYFPTILYEGYFSYLNTGRSVKTHEVFILLLYAFWSFKAVYCLHIA